MENDILQNKIIMKKKESNGQLVNLPTYLIIYLIGIIFKNILYIL